jgi:hypothetical protein
MSLTFLKFLLLIKALLKNERGFVVMFVKSMFANF